MPQQTKKSLVLSICFALAASTLLVFWQVRNFDFVNYDDDVYVYENPHILTGLTADTIFWTFKSTDAANWHPLTWLSHILDWRLYGKNPAGHHITNLIFHIINVLLLFIVLRKMTNTLWRSAFVAALFALHPLHVESVAWVAERKDVLSTFFLLLTIWSYVHYVSRPKVVSYLLLIVFFALGLMSKPMLVTLPFVLLLLDYWPLNRLGSKRSLSYLLIEKIPLFAMTAAASVVTFIVQKKEGAMHITENFDFPFRLANPFISYVQYIVKMIWPVRLTIFYPSPGQNVSFFYAAMSAGFLLIATILVIRFSKNHRYLFTGWFWYLGTLVPVIGIVQVGDQAMADRYTYITLTGLFIIIAWGLPELFSKLPQRKIALGLSMAIVLATLAIIAHRQVSCWKNSFTLFSHANQVTQNNYLAHNNLGIAYSSLGRQQEAIDEFGLAIKIRPNYAMAFYNLGIVYEKLDRPNEAIAADKQAIIFKLDYAEAHYNLGLFYDKLNRSGEAIEAYNQAIKIKPNYAKAYLGLGVVYIKLGRGADAIDAFRQAIRIEPGYAEAHNNLGIAFGRLGRWPQAIDACKQAVRFRPDDAEAHYNLGDAYLAIGDKNSALAEYNILKSLKSEFADNLLKEINK